jgi:hypothetical protein
MLEAINTLGSEGLATMQALIKDQQLYNETMGMFPEDVDAVRQSVLEMGNEFQIAHQDKVAPLLDTLDNFPAKVYTAFEFDFSLTNPPDWLIQLMNMPGPTQGQLGETTETGYTGETQGQHGLRNFRVPPGYPNDSFPVWVSSGETVNVDPHGRSGQTIGDITVNVYPPAGMTNPKAVGEYAARRAYELIGRG